MLRSGGQVRITAQLIQAPQDKHLWASSYQGDLRDVLGLQNRVASAIAQEIKVTLTPQEQTRLKSGRAVDPRAYENYLLGRYFWNKRDGGALRKALDYFQQAIEIDLKYAPAYAGLAQTYVLAAGSLGPEDQFLAEARKAAQYALKLDPNLAEAHTTMALLLEHDYNFAQGEAEFKLAVTLVPNYATAHHWYGEAYLAVMGRFEEANRELQQALLLDPASRVIATDWGVVLYFERRYRATLISTAPRRKPQRAQGSQRNHGALIRTPQKYSKAQCLCGFWGTTEQAAEKALLKTSDGLRGLKPAVKGNDYGVAEATSFQNWHSFSSFPRSVELCPSESH